MSAIEAYRRMYSVTEAVEELQETTVPAYMHPDVEEWDHHSKVSPQTKEKISTAFGCPNLNSLSSSPCFIILYSIPMFDEVLVNLGVR